MSLYFIISIVAHSQGCLVTGILSPDNITKTILNASPVESPYSRMKQYFSKREGTEINEEGLSRIARSDGSWTLVESGFWKDIKQVEPTKLYSELARKTELYFIRAREDHVITDKNYEAIVNNESIEYMELPGNHDFADDARSNWLKKVVEIIKS